MLKAMRRNHTREAYLKLIGKMRTIIPGVTISTDMISGFCGETEEDHQDTLSLMREVEYDAAYMYAYSMREKTHAHRKLQDDVPEAVKKRRLAEVIDVFRSTLDRKVQREVGRQHLVLVEGTARRSNQQLQGRSDTNQRVVFDKVDGIVPGDYVLVEIESATAQTLKGKAISKSSIAEWSSGQ